MANLWGRAQPMEQGPTYRALFVALNITLVRLCRAHLLLGVLISLNCGVASAQNVLEQVRLKVYFLDVYISTTEKTCAEKHPELSESLASVRRQFHQKLLPEIELGKEFGKTFAAARGRDIQNEAEQIARQGLMKHSLANPSRSSRQLCDEAIREFNDRGKWTIDDFLREDFQSLMVDIGNRQGFPCNFIAMRLEGIAHRFIDGRGKSPDAQQFIDQLLSFEVRDLADKVSNCIAVQARAVEYRVVPGKELQKLQEVLISLQGALMPDWERRIENGDDERLATQRVKEFLIEREQK